MFSFLVTEALLVACFPLPGAHQQHDQSYPRRSPRRQHHYGQRRVCRSPNSLCLSPMSLPSSCTSAKRPAGSAAYSQMATSVLSPPNLSVAEVSAQCVFLAVESCGVHGKRFDGNIAPSGSVSKVAYHPRSIGKLMKGIDDTLPDNNIITVDAESIGFAKASAQPVFKRQ